MLLFLTGLYKTLVVILYVAGRVLLQAVVFIPVGLTGGPVTSRAVFLTISLSGHLTIIFYRHHLALAELIDSHVSLSRMQVNPIGGSGPGGANPGAVWQWSRGPTQGVIWHWSGGQPKGSSDRGQGGQPRGLFSSGHGPTQGLSGNGFW